MAPNIIATELYTNEPLDAEVVDYAVIKGDKGDKGDTGLTPAFSIGEVTTLDYSQPASANITGTDEAPVLNLGIPKGEDAYTQAVEGGYTGDEEEFNSDLANIKTYAYRAEAAEENAETYAANASASASAASDSASSAASAATSASGYAATARGAASDASGFASTASAKATEASQSAATAEQAATTATQKAADASDSATAAAGSATSASASATAAGNAQSAAETAQGKAEEAQEAAETAAQSIEDSAAQIDENTAGLVELKSALNTKAGILRDTVSGSVASFVPDSTVPNLLGLSVALDPIQDLHGYDSPWPTGGGKNKFGCADGTFAIGSTRTVTVADGIWVYRVNTAATSYVFLPEKTVVAMAIPALKPGTYTFSLASNVDVSTVIDTAVLNLSDGQAITNGNSFTISADTSIVSITTTVSGSYNIGTYTCQIQIESGSTATSWTPYSNICPISGRDSVEVSNTSTNIWDEQWENGGLNGATGLVYTSTTRIVSKNFIPVSGGISYFVKGPVVLSLAWYDASKTYIYGSDSLSPNYARKAPENAAYLKFSFAVATYNHDISINYPSTDHDYHPYAGNTYTIQLGDTVYGGTLDVTNGTLTVDRAMVDLGSLYWRYTRDYGFLSGLPEAKKFSTNVSTIICSKYATTRYTINPPDFTIALGGWSLGTTLIVADSTFGTDATAFKNGSVGVQLCYELATPITIDLDPVTIATIANQTNNVWADAGDVTVEFAADLKTYIDNKIAAAVAALS